MPGINLSPRPKFAIIGMGDIGQATIVRMLAKYQNVEFILYNRTREIAEQFAHVLQGEVGASKRNNILRVSNDPWEGPWKEITDAKVIIVTSGMRLAKLEGAQDRSALFDANARIMIDIGHKIGEAYYKVRNSEENDQPKNEPFCIVVANPNDDMSGIFRMVTGFEKVLGVGSTLDTIRFKTFLLEKLNDPTLTFDDIIGWVVGPHNNSMVFLNSLVHVRGVPLAEYIVKDKASLPPGQIGITEEELLAVHQATAIEGIRLSKEYPGNGPAHPTAFAILYLLEAYLSSYQQVSAVSASIALQNTAWGTIEEDTSIGLPVMFSRGNIRILEPDELSQYTHWLAAITTRNLEPEEITEYYIWLEALVFQRPDKNASEQKSL